jgi:tetratricopeptide (TPR) repeat protein
VAKKRHSQPVQPSHRFRNVAPALILMGLTIIAYLPAFRAGFIWDDPDYVTQNATLRSLDGLRQIWFVPRSLPQWYPMVHTTFWLEYQTWGLWAPGYHAVNVLLHAANAVLLYAILQKLQFPAAWLAAAVFAVHPVHVESVAWVTERKNVLSGVFYLAAMLVYLKGSGFGVQGSGNADASSSVSPEPRTLNPRLYTVSLLFFMLALWSKTVTCSLPAAILLILWWKRGRITWADLRPLMPFFVLGAASAMYTGHLERAHVGASGAEFDFSPIDRMLIAGRAVWFYVWKLILPMNLSFIYPRWEIDPAKRWLFAFPIAAVLLVVALFMLRRRIGRGPLVALLFFGGTVLPALGFVNVYPMRYSFVADHFQYLASIGVIVLLIAVLRRVVGKTTPYMPIVLIPLGLMTFAQARVYENKLTLWTDTAAKNPRSWMVQTNLGDALADSGEPDKAFDRYQEALRLAPDLPETHWNVGIGLARRNDFDGAMHEYDEALRVSGGTFPQAHYSRGNIYLDRGEIGDAQREFNLAIQQKPGYAEAHFKLGFIAEQQKRPDDAIAHYTAAVQHRMGFAEAHYNLANVLMAQQRLNEALVHYSQVIRLEPKKAEAHANIGWAFLQLGQVDNAIRAFNAALAINPNLVPAQRGLERAMQSPGRKSP